MSEPSDPPDPSGGHKSTRRSSGQKRNTATRRRPLPVSPNPNIETSKATEPKVTRTNTPSTMPRQTSGQPEELKPEIQRLIKATQRDTVEGTCRILAALWPDGQWCPEERLPVSIDKVIAGAMRVLSTAWKGSGRNLVDLWAPGGIMLQAIAQGSSEQLTQKNVTAARRMVLEVVGNPRRSDDIEPLLARDTSASDPEPDKAMSGEKTMTRKRPTPPSPETPAAKRVTFDPAASPPPRLHSPDGVSALVDIYEDPESQPTNKTLADWMAASIRRFRRYERLTEFDLVECIRLFPPSQDFHVFSTDIPDYGYEICVDPNRVPQQLFFLHRYTNQWSLVHFDRNSNVIRHFNSGKHDRFSGNFHAGSFEKWLRRSQLFTESEFRITEPDCPQHTHSVDSGVFVLVWMLNILTGSEISQSLDAKAWRFFFLNNLAGGKRITASSATELESKAIRAAGPLDPDLARGRFCLNEAGKGLDQWLAGRLEVVQIISGIERSVGRMIAEVAPSEDHLTSLRGDLAKADQRIDDLESQLEKAKEERVILRSQMQTLSDDIGRKKEEISMIQAEKARMQESLNQNIELAHEYGGGTTGIGQTWKRMHNLSCEGSDCNS